MVLSFQKSNSERRGRNFIFLFTCFPWNFLLNPKKKMKWPSLQFGAMLYQCIIWQWNVTFQFNLHFGWQLNLAICNLIERLMHPSILVSHFHPSHPECSHKFTISQTLFMGHFALFRVHFFPLTYFHQFKGPFAPSHTLKPLFFSHFNCLLLDVKNVCECEAREDESEKEKERKKERETHKWSLL